MHPGNKRTTLMRTASTSVPLESLAMANIEMFRDKKKTGELTMLQERPSIKPRMYAYIRNKHFFTKSCHRQTYQNYEQPP